MTTASNGPVLFSRFAYPPHRRGYCGAAEHGEVLRVGQTEVFDAGFAEVARGFAGAYPYLQLIAGCNRIDDPLDHAVVEAYWLGNRLLRQVSTHDLGVALDGRFRRRAGVRWGRIEDTVPVGCANHSYHVLGVSPWVGLLRQGIIDEPLAALDACRISWGRVVEVAAGEVLVESPPLVWNGAALGIGLPTKRVVSTIVPVEPGDVVALHWDCICDSIDQRQLANLVLLTTQLLDRPFAI